MLSGSLYEMCSTPLECMADGDGVWILSSPLFPGQLSSLPLPCPQNASPYPHKAEHQPNLASTSPGRCGGRIQPLWASATACAGHLPPGVDQTCHGMFTTLRLAQETCLSRIVPLVRKSADFILNHMTSNLGIMSDIQPAVYV